MRLSIHLYTPRLPVIQRLLCPLHPAEQAVIAVDRFAVPSEIVRLEGGHGQRSKFIAGYENGESSDMRCRPICPKTSTYLRPPRMFS